MFIEVSDNGIHLKEGRKGVIVDLLDGMADADSLILGQRHQDHLTVAFGWVKGTMNRLTPAEKIRAPSTARASRLLYKDLKYQALSFGRS